MQRNILRTHGVAQGQLRPACVVAHDLPIQLNCFGCAGSHRARKQFSLVNDSVDGHHGPRGNADQPRARILGKKLSPRIEGNPDIATPECVKQQLIVDRIQPLQYAAHQTHLAAELGG